MTKEIFNIGPQLNKFFTNAYREVKPNYIVTVERKGTALMRSVIKSSAHISDGIRNWEKFISHQALENDTNINLKDSKILIVEDSVSSGKKITDVINLLKLKCAESENIKVAAFCVREGVERKLVDYQWYGQATEDTYRQVNDSLIKYFQRKGSLLLDTEHIEIPIDLINCSHIELFNALSKCGNSVAYISKGDRINLTIYNPKLLEETNFIKNLPNGSRLTNVVKKIRVVERSKNKFTIIPIFYPAIPITTQLKDYEYLEEPFKEMITEANKDKWFNVIGMYAAIQLFKLVGVCLSTLYKENKISIASPGVGTEDDSISHLKVIFPDIKVDELSKYIVNKINEGIFQHKLAKELIEPILIDASKGTPYYHLLKYFYWQNIKRIYDFSYRIPTKPKGATLPEILNEINENEIDLLLNENKIRKSGLNITTDIYKALMSTALDQVIDEAIVNTDVTEKLYNDNVIRKTRLFRIDNEVALSDVSKILSIYRSPLSIMKKEFDNYE